MDMDRAVGDVGRVGRVLRVGRIRCLGSGFHRDQG
jgi:hypothetical protein